MAPGGVFQHPGIQGAKPARRGDLRHGPVLATPGPRVQSCRWSRLSLAWRAMAKKKIKTKKPVRRKTRAPVKKPAPKTTAKKAAAKKPAALPHPRKRSARRALIPGIRR